MRHLLPISLSLLLLFILSLAGISVYQQIQVKAYQKKVTALASTTAKLKMETSNTNSPTQVLGAATTSSRLATVSKIMNTYKAKVKGDISIYYKNLTNGETAVIDGDRKYYMASLYKVIITLYVLEREKKGEISLSDRVGSPSATLDQALTKVITESNNEYAVAIAQKYGWNTIEDFIKAKYDLDFTFKGDLTTNVKTMGSIFQIISESIKLSDTESHYLLDLLNHQTRLSKLPKYLPKSIYSHNKTGELDDYSHDAGLFYTPKANYILIFMSKTPSPGTTNELMALMSKEIYETLNQ